MFETITKKEFIRVLQTSENQLLYSNLSLMEAGCTKIMKALHNGNFTIHSGRRCTKANSNSLLFNDGSKLYFNSIEKCYRHNNVILSYGEQYDTFDECYRYSILAYVIQ